MCVHMYVYIYMCVCVCVCEYMYIYSFLKNMCVQKCIYVPLQPIPWRDMRIQWNTMQYSTR